MFGSVFYKLGSKRQLKGNYLGAFIAALIYIIPIYISTMLDDVLTRFMSASPIGAGLIGTLTDVLINLLIINIITVGFYRFLLCLKPNYGNEEPCKYDFNILLSGYTHDFKNVFKITFLKQLYIFGWSLFALAPIAAFIGVTAWLAVTSDVISRVYNMFVQLAASPTPDMLMNIAEYISENCPFLPALSAVVMIAFFAALIPLVLKSYEYAMIPMIAADRPGISAEEAFDLTSRMMRGFRMRFFMLELSFILYLFLPALILAFTGSTVVYFIVQALIIPYQYGAYLEFYKDRAAAVSGFAPIEEYSNGENI